MTAPRSMYSGVAVLFTGHHSTDHVGASHADNGKLLVAEGFVFWRDFGFTVFELAFPTLNVGLNSTSLALAEVIELEEWAVLLAVVESGFDHVTGGFANDPRFFWLEGEVTDFKEILRGESRERES